MEIMCTIIDSCGKYIELDGQIVNAKDINGDGDDLGKF